MVSDTLSEPVFGFNLEKISLNFFILILSKAVFGFFFEKMSSENFLEKSFECDLKGANVRDQKSLFFSCVSNLF